MSLKCVLAVGCFVALTGCASTQTIHTGGDGGPTYAEVNKAIRGQVAHVRFKDGTEMPMFGLVVAPDSISWVDGRENRLVKAPTSSVADVEIVRAGRGALWGAAIGALVGAGVGAIRAVILGDDPPGEVPFTTMEQKLRIYPQAHALYFSLGTAPLGAAIGKKVHYRFDGANGAISQRAERTEGGR